MANIRISALPAVTTVVPDTDVLPLVSGGITTKVTPTGIISKTLEVSNTIGIGIASASASSKLHIRQDQNGTTQTIIQNRNASGTPLSALTFITGAFDLSSNRYAQILSGGGATNYLAFLTSNSAAPVEQARIDATGNLLLGKTTNVIGTKLNVNGTINETVSSTEYLVASQYDVGSAPNQVPLNQFLGNLAFMSFVPLVGNGTSAPTIASATTIAPTTAVSFVSGTTAIATITVPYSMVGGGQITLIPTGIFTTTTAGNIALASTAVVSKALILTYDAVTAKWYPSY